MTVYSICTGMGLLDYGFALEGIQTYPLCEIDDRMRYMYGQLLRRSPVYTCLADVLCKHPYVTRAGIIGGPPCQSHTKLRAIRTPKYPDLTSQVQQLVDLFKPAWYLFENVVPIHIAGAKHVMMDAMNWARPHQSRPRWFTYSGIQAPTPAPFPGTVDSLMAYPVVAGRIYGPTRGAILQGIPPQNLPEAPCKDLQMGLANGVHVEIARAWARQVAGILEK